MKTEKADGSGFFYYKMPLGYRLGWIADNEEFNSNEILPGWWTFWMPDKRYPEIKLGYSLLTQSHGCEQGRSGTLKNEYLVTFGVQSLSPKHQRHSTPEQAWRMRFKNADKDITLESGILTRDLHSRFTGLPFAPPEKLSSARVSEELIGRGFGKIYYRNPTKHPFQFMFECDDWGQKICLTQFYFPDKNLNLKIRFTRNHLDHWREILSASIELLDSWKVEEDQLPLVKGPINH